MVIYIPTKGRRNNQLTMRNLPREIQERVVFACPEKEAFWLKQDFPMASFAVQPDPDMGIAAKRQWLLENCHSEKLVMLDDDLRFAVRREDEPAKFLKATNDQINKAFQELEAVLSEDIPHAGFSARGAGIGTAAQKGGWQMGKRMMYVLAYHVPTVKANAQFGRLRTHEDMDVCLQLLLKGYPNMVNYSFVVDQKFGNPGGCTDERTVSINNADSIKLAELHPGYVRISHKTYETSESRIEVVCQWLNAMHAGLADRDVKKAETVVENESL
jgi:hypothetical protein